MEINDLVKERDNLHKNRNKLDIKIQLIQKGVSDPSEQQIDRLVRLANRIEKANAKVNMDIQNIQRQHQIELQEIQSEIEGEIELMKDKPDIE